VGGLALGYLVAEDADKGKEFLAAAYRARWEHGLNLSDPAVIADVQEKSASTRSASSTRARGPGHARPRGIEMLRLVYKDGVFGVPMFMHGQDKFWGTDRCWTSWPPSAAPACPAAAGRGAVLLTVGADTVTPAAAAEPPARMPVRPPRWSITAIAALSS